ncbi:MAG: hypothetical protein IPM29_17520 [Planctomycetes bacterium]|nr:hypothetical protein [Planctomycetota bacterium]
MLTALERDVCDHLTQLGVTHSHRPRHFEITLDDGSLAAYAPTMVVRGRGREGKSVVIETCDAVGDPQLAKIRAFRRQYGVEFYVCLVATVEELLEELPFDAYDESSALRNMHTMVGRLAD